MTLFIQTKHHEITIDIGRALQMFGKAILTAITIASFWMCAVIIACL